MRIILIKMTLKSNQITLYGAGELGLKTLNFLKSQNIDVQYFIDNKPKPPINQIEVLELNSLNSSHAVLNHLIIVTIWSPHVNIGNII